MYFVIYEGNQQCKKFERGRLNLDLSTDNLNSDNNNVVDSSVGVWTYRVGFRTVECVPARCFECHSHSQVV